MRATALGLTVVVLAACSVSPEPLTTEQTVARAKQDRAGLTSEQEPIDGPITLYEAIARALLYNLEQRQALMEEALQSRQLDLTTFDMLPRLAASAGYTARSNTNASSSESIFSGRQTLEPSTSEDRHREIADLSVSWNLLDFGVSYYQARQQADRVLIAEQRRRRVVNNTVQEVRSAFWQAATAERLLDKIEPLLAEGQQALERAEEIERQRLQSPVDTLRYQKSLLEILQQLRGLRADLQAAKARLGSLMNIAPGTEITLQAPEPEEVTVPDLDADLQRLELLALVYRPELREEDYQKRIGHHEVRTAMLRMLPGLSFDGNLNFDSNSFLHNNTWAQATTQVSWNLISLISGPSAIKAAEAQVEVANSRRLAVSMAVVTQVNLAVRRYQRAVLDYNNAVKLEAIEQRIFSYIDAAEAGDAGSKLDQIRGAASAMSAELSRDQAYSEIQSALGNIYASIGVDPLPSEIRGRDLDSVIAAVREVAQRWEDARFPDIPDAPSPAHDGAAAPDSPETGADGDRPAGDEADGRDADAGAGGDGPAVSQRAPARSGAAARLKAALPAEPDVADRRAPHVAVALNLGVAE